MLGLPSNTHKHNRPRRRPATNNPNNTNYQHLRRANLCLTKRMNSLAAISVAAFFLFLLQAAPTNSQLQQANYLLPQHNLENVRVPESTPVNTVVHQLKAADRLNENRKFSYHMTGDTFSVDETTGDVRLMRPLDRERQAQLVVVVSVFDSADVAKNELPVETRRRLIAVDDVDDSWPIFSGQHRNSLANNPTQGVYAYQAELSEMAPIGSVVLTDVQVTDADEGSNAELVFECRSRSSTNSACDAFAIDSRRMASGKYSVSIRTKAALDYERVHAYKLALVARGRRPSPIKGAPLEAEATVYINVLNAQDEGPVFVNAPYSLSVPEGLKQGSRLLSLVVQDGDAAPQRDLSMIVVPGPHSDHFQVIRDLDDNRVWHLETNVTMDRESPNINNFANMFTIGLLAAELDDSGSPVASESELLSALREPVYARGTLRKENVTVVVLDIPDSRPIFVYASTGAQVRNNLVVLNVSEALATGVAVPGLDLAVEDLDLGANARFNLSLMDSDQGPAASQAFALDATTVYGRTEIVLSVLNASLIDYEQEQFRVYKFNLVASKSIEPPLVQILEVQIQLQDANDNYPEFERDQYLAEIPEASPPGTLVTVIRAQDRDSGVYGRVEYLLRGQGASKFKLLANEGKIVVNDCNALQCLDYEQQHEYSLTYEARDGGGKVRNTSLLIQLLDINDHAPKFTEQVYRRELIISDNLVAKQSFISPQLLIRANDEDHVDTKLPDATPNITYRILATNLTQLEVDPKSGLVRLKGPVELDPSRAIINNGRALVYEADVLAEDNGTPSLNATAKVVLIVRGQRDGAPLFRHDYYQASVRENQPPGKAFFQVQAYDPDDKDSQLRYSLGSDLDDLVSIGASTGEISFKRRVDYDDFADSSAGYNVTVYVTDNSKPEPLRASTIVSIVVHDVNDKPPKFTQRQYTAHLVQGAARRGDRVLQVQALDPDKNAQLNYSLLTDQIELHDRNGQLVTLDDLLNSMTSPNSGYLAQMSPGERRDLATSVKNLFTINMRTGVIELATEPDYSWLGAVRVPVRVIDTSQEVFTASGELQQDVAACVLYLETQVDTKPVFAGPAWNNDKRSYNVTMLEELSVGSTIFALLANEPSGDRVDSFEKLPESDPRDLFRVERSGVVTVNRRIDYEQLMGSKQVSFSVRALSGADSTVSAVAEVYVQVVDVNDNAPQFRQTNYSVAVSEASAAGAEIVTVHAEDRDSVDHGQVYYALAPTHSSELFVMDSRRGTLKLRKGARLDRDTEPVHTIRVIASDCNDTTSDLSAALTPTSMASGCKRSAAFVHIRLVDENDNDPVFVNANKRGEFEALVAETAAPGTIVAHVHAQDLDEAANGQVSYEIVRGTGTDELASRALRVDPDGLISVTDSLAGMGRSSAYRITVRAQDGGKPSRQAYAHLLLTISDVVSNDGVPKFVRPRHNETVELSESAGPGAFVYQAVAVDPDEEANGKLMYKFVQPSDIFDIDPFTGVISTQLRPSLIIDREMVANYTLIIVAQDLGSPPKQAHAMLVVRVADINDNEPYFERAIDAPPVVVWVQEELSKGTVLATVQAVDKDAGPNALIGYEIIDGNQNNMFALDFVGLPTTSANHEHDQQHRTGSSNVQNNSTQQQSSNNLCRIVANARLDREIRSSYLFTIKAVSLAKVKNPFLLHQQLRDPLAGRNPFNQYNASDLSKIRIHIKLADINDNRPVFVQAQSKSVVESSAETYSQLMVFKAHDPDDESDEIVYSILDALYYSDSKMSAAVAAADGAYAYGLQQATAGAGVSSRQAFDIDARAGIVRNAVSLRPYVDGYFELWVKADSGADRQAPGDDYATLGGRRGRETGCVDPTSLAASGNGVASGDSASSNTTAHNTAGPYAHLENCHVAVTKATVFVTHQRETFRFVFNKTRLNDRLDEFKDRVQTALEEIMFEQPARAEKVYLNTFNTDFYERDDGSLDFATLTSCSQLVKFDDAKQAHSAGSSMGGIEIRHGQVPNQVITYDEVLSLFKALNASQLQQQQQQHHQNQQQAGSARHTRAPSTNLFSQYGLVSIERCMPDKITYKMSLSERLAVYVAAGIALVAALLALIVSKMRKRYEKHLKLLQRSKYQYLVAAAAASGVNGQSGPGAYATMAGQLSPRAMAHHMSMASLHASHPSTYLTSPYAGSQLDFDACAAAAAAGVGDPGAGPPYDTWQL